MIVYFLWLKINMGSIVSLNAGIVPSLNESSRLISQAVLRDQTQSQRDMQIKSSKAFDIA